MENESIVKNNIEEVGRIEEIPLQFCDLPDDVLELIMAFFSYDETAHLRIICHRMNGLCSRILNSAFNKTTLRHATLFKRIKKMLPRRESERRFVFILVPIRFCVSTND